MTSPSRDHRLRVLVIDDTFTVLRLMESVLLRAGFAVTCVERGSDALKVAEVVKPDVVLLDTALPDMAAGELCRLLASHVPGVRVVLLSPTENSAGWSHPAVVAHIARPFTPQAVLTVMEGVLHNGGGTAGGSGSDLPTAAASPVPLFENSGAPSLAGDMADVPVGDILQSLAQQRQTGILTAERANARVYVPFENGALRMVSGQNMGSDLLLGSILVSERLLAADELGALLRNRRGSRRPLGQQLVQLGYLAATDLARALTRQSAELVYELLRWRSGRFAFHRWENLPPALRQHELGVGLEQLLIEGFRRMDEWGVVEKVLPSFDAVLVRTDSSVAQPASLNEEEQAVYDQVDGHRRAREILENVGGGSFAVGRILCRLLSAGCISMRSTLSVERQGHE